MYQQRGVSEKGGTPKSSNFIKVFHYKPSILGYPYFWKHPYIYLTSKNPYFPLYRLFMAYCNPYMTREYNPKIYPKQPGFCLLNGSYIPFHTLEISSCIQSLYNGFLCTLKNKKQFFSLLRCGSFVRGHPWNVLGHWWQD